MQILSKGFHTEFPKKLYEEFFKRFLERFLNEFPKVFLKKLLKEFSKGFLREILKRFLDFSKFSARKSFQKHFSNFFNDASKKGQRFFKQ